MDQDKIGYSATADSPGPASGSIHRCDLAAAGSARNFCIAVPPGRMRQELKLGHSQ
jgi:hypothetical protein